MVGGVAVAMLPFLGDQRGLPRHDWVTLVSVHRPALCPHVTVKVQASASWSSSLPTFIEHLLCALPQETIKRPLRREWPGLCAEAKEASAGGAQ